MSGLARGVFEFAALKKVDLSDVLEAHGLSVESLNESTYVNVSAHEALWSACHARTGVENVGMVAASTYSPGLTGAVEYVMRSASTLREAIESWIRFAPAVSDVVSSHLELTSTQALWYWSLNLPYSDGTRHWTEFALGRGLSMTRECVGEPSLAPDEVWFSHSASANSEVHDKFFRAPVVFECRSNGFAFPRELLDLPVKGHDPALLHVLESHAVQLLEGDEKEATRRCRRAIRAELDAEEPDLRMETFATRLGLSVRTLQRRLSDEGNKFSDLLDLERQEAYRKLQGEFPEETLALKLGYFDGAALRKARYRWRQSAAETKA